MAVLLAVWPDGRNVDRMAVCRGMLLSPLPAHHCSAVQKWWVHNFVQRYNDGREAGTEESRYMAILYMYERYEIFTFFSKYVTMEKNDIFHHNF